MTPHDIPWPATSTPPCDCPEDVICGHEAALYAEIDRIAGGGTDPLGMGGLRPIPVATLTPPTLHDVLAAARAAGWHHRDYPLGLDHEHTWERGDTLISWHAGYPQGGRLSVQRRKGGDLVRWWDDRLIAYLDTDPATAVAQAVALLTAIGLYPTEAVTS